MGRQPEWPRTAGGCCTPPPATTDWTASHQPHQQNRQQLRDPGNTHTLSSISQCFASMFLQYVQVLQNITSQCPLKHAVLILLHRPNPFFYTFLQIFQKFPNLFLNQHCQISFNIFLKLCRKLLYEINFF